MADKENRAKKKNNKSNNKKESRLVTKESVCATFALFCLLALLILCTRSLIFGDLGIAVHSFLTGVFGYFVYPLIVGGLYLSVMGLLGKKLVTNYRLGFCIALTLVFIGLIVHTVLTYSWSLDGYIARCYQAGALFPKTTVTGWLGGVIVFGVAKIANKIGAIILFSLLTGFCIYLCVIAGIKGKKNADSKDSGERKSQKPAQSNSGAVEVVEIPLSTSQPAAQSPASQQGTLYPEATANGQAVQQNAQEATAEQAAYARSPFAYGEVPALDVNAQQQQTMQTGNPYTVPQVNQRPGVTLTEERAAQPAQPRQNTQPTGAFSPFGNTGTVRNEQSGYSYEDSRDILFSTTPAESYRKNLLFDPNSNANRRPSTEPNQAALGGTSGFVPSYSEAYQNSVNENTEPSRPVKIVSDNVQTPYNTYGTQESAPSITPLQPIEEKPVLDVRDVSYSTFEERTPERESSILDVSDRGRDTAQPSFDREERGEEGRSGADNNTYRRHNYMDLFSSANPNLFGNDEDVSARDFGLRNEEDQIESREERNAFDRVDSREERDGYNLLDDDDEETENPYELRSDFNVRDSGGGRESSRDESFDSSRMGFGRDESSGREEFLTDRNSDREIGFTPSVEPSVPVKPATPAKPVQESKPTPPPKPRVIRPYVRVPLDDFDCRDIEPSANMAEVEETKANIIATLEDFKVTGASIASVTFGPTVTRYNVTIPRSISPKKVVALDQSIAISLHSSGVNVYPNYEDGVVSIEVPNKDRQFVQLGCMLSGDTFVNAKSSSLMFAMGKDVANRKVYGDISKMIHLLVAGSSGSGKSVFLGSLIISLIYKYSPEELRLILIDPKKTEFVLYNDLPHLMINEIITDVNKTVQSLNWAIGEMNRRYGLFEQMSRSGTYVVNLDQYNAQLEKNKRLPKIVIIIDELADLMLAAKKEMEDRIQNLTQKARAAGIHLIVATQRPSTDVITGVIKSNLPTRVAFYVATDVDSRVILDQSGAQKLLGKGDLVYTMPGLAAPVRVQSAFISPEDSQKVVNFIKNNNEAYYDEEATAYINSRGGYAGEDSSGGSGDKESIDPMYIEALRHVILSGSASISMIQRKCSAGYNRAGKIIEWMEEMGYISPFDGAKARKVLITKEEFESKYGPLQ